MTKQKHGGRQNRSSGGSGGGGRGGGGGSRGGGGGGRGGRGGRGGGGGSTKLGKLSYNSGEEPAFIRQFKERTGYKPPATTDDKRRTLMNDVNDNDEGPRDGDYRKDDEKPQIVQLGATDLSKEEVEIEIAKVKEAEEEKNCIDSTGRLLFRKPKEKSDESDTTTTTSKSDIVEMASNKTNKRKHTTASTTTEKESHHHHEHVNEPKKTKTQLLSFMHESGFDGDD
ncbi:unnamed protein product [Rotaria magnacalcarata]|uniref:DUF4604 domain-containing protein n=4 Tax=Rotaria magnacalcarata TaxID=392030 RepID=A0A819D6V3_9BILA|nr:unnamed protein product [Rotaria magnacalcarata]CAF2253887.1 unnamed protein product [Rotaria magnacalcarata]CAF3831685.1 unnamed protein product [Rotaria magnacalcarata]CAF3872621.1 unnamed protein product [Rotaria magnacalcarata]